MSVYADFGTNTNFTTEVTPTGSGTMGDPYNARAWNDRVKFGGSGSQADEWLVKGKVFNLAQGDSSKFAQMESMDPWDPLVNGPYRINCIGALAMGKGGSPSSDPMIMRGGIIKATQINNRKSAKWQNCLMLGDFGMTENNGSQVLIEGCAIVGDWKSAGNSNNSILIKDTYWEGDFVNTHLFLTGAQTFETSSFTESQATIDSKLTGGPATTFTGCEFDIVPNEARPGFDEADPEVFRMDTAISIVGLDDYANIPCGLFGNNRSVFHMNGSVGAIGAHYFQISLAGSVAGLDNENLSMGIGISL